jgi:hypothetical protein
MGNVLGQLALLYQLRRLFDDKAQDTLGKFLDRRYGLIFNLLCSYLDLFRYPSGATLINSL